MKRITKKLAFLLIVFLYFTSCNKDNEIQTLSGNIVGFVDLVDEVGQNIEDKSGVTVTIEGTSIIAISNSDGRYELVNVPAGTYNLNFSKNGFGTIKYFSYQYIGGNVPTILSKRTLLELPNVSFSNVSVELNYDMVLSVQGTLSELKNTSFMACVCDNPKDSDGEYDAVSLIYTHYASSGVDFNHTFYFKDVGYELQQYVYVQFYAINPVDDYRYIYYDPIQDKNYHTTTIKIGEPIGVRITY